MAKRLMFGWCQRISKDTKKPFKLLVLGRPSDDWHGYSVDTKYCPGDVQIPDCKPGSLISIEFDENGFVDSGCEIKILNG